VLPKPVRRIATATPAAIEAGVVTVYVNVVPDKATVPAPMPTTEPTTGVPEVPVGTVIVTDDKVPVVAVVKA
jgi:hypothetical protein